MLTNPLVVIEMYVARQIYWTRFLIMGTIWVGLGSHGFDAVLQDRSPRACTFLFRRCYYHKNRCAWFPLGHATNDACSISINLLGYEVSCKVSLAGQVLLLVPNGDIGCHLMPTEWNSYERQGPRLSNNGHNTHTISTMCFLCLSEKNQSEIEFFNSKQWTIRVQQIGSQECIDPFRTHAIVTF